MSFGSLTVIGQHEEQISYEVDNIFEFGDGGSEI